MTAKVSSIIAGDRLLAPPIPERPVKLRDPQLYINRELAQLEFISRVLRQTVDDQVPLLERLRFLCITSLLVDEFFEVRVASLKQRIQHGAAKPGADGLTATATLQGIRHSVLALVREQ